MLIARTDKLAILIYSPRVCGFSTGGLVSVRGGSATRRGSGGARDEATYVRALMSMNFVGVTHCEEVNMYLPNDFQVRTERVFSARDTHLSFALSPFESGKLCINHHRDD